MLTSVLFFTMLEFHIALVLCLISFGCTDGDQLHKDHRSKRVISNKYATPHSRPWMVILTRDGNVSCGAALINRPPYHTEGLDEGSSDMLLTAAHCVIEMFEEKVLRHSMDPKRFTALFGKHNSTGYEEGQIEIPIINIIVHPLIKVHYNRVFNDIALLKLEKPVNFSRTIKPIALSNFSIDEVTNCTIAGWGRYKQIPANLDPNSILSILDLRNVEQFVDSFVVEIEHQNETITKGDSGAPATCWKDGRVFIQGVLASARVKEEIKNFGEYNLNISILEDIQFTDVNAMKRWIVETFQHVDTPSLWHRNLSQYGHNLMEQPSYSSILMNEELLNGYYCDTQGPYNHELITPWWSHADYLRLWFENKIHDHLLNDTKIGKFDIQRVIGYTKQSDPYLCAIDCFLWNGNRPCIFAFTMSRCFFSAVDSIGFHYKSPLEGLAIHFKGAKKNLKEALSISFELPKSIVNRWEVSVILEKHKNIHCFGMLISSRGKAFFNRVKVSSKCYAALRKVDKDMVVLVTAIINGKIYSAPVGSSDIRKPNSMSISLPLLLPIPQIDQHMSTYGHQISPNEEPTLRNYNPNSGAFKMDPSYGPNIVQIVGRWGDTCYGVIIQEPSLKKSSEISQSSPYILTTASCASKNYYEVLAGRYFMDSDSLWSQNGRIDMIHIHPNYSDSNRASDNIAIIELVYPIYFNSRINPAIFISSSDSLENSNPFALTYDVACNYHEEKPLNRVPMGINSVTDDVDAADIVAERQFYIHNNESCLQQINRDGEPLFAYNNASREYKLLGLMDRVIIQNSKLVESFKSIRYYTPWIVETLEKLTTAKRERVKIPRGRMRKKFL